MIFSIFFNKKPCFLLKKIEKIGKNGDFRVFPCSHVSPGRFYRLQRISNRNPLHRFFFLSGAQAGTRQLMRPAAARAVGAHTRRALARAGHARRSRAHCHSSHQCPPPIISGRSPHPCGAQPHISGASQTRSSPLLPQAQRAPAERLENFFLAGYGRPKKFSWRPWASWARPRSPGKFLRASLGDPGRPRRPPKISWAAKGGPRNFLGRKIGPGNFRTPS